jgi:hypothetical protein
LPASGRQLQGSFVVIGKWVRFPARYHFNG